MSDYHRSITVSKAADSVYAALTEGIANWWTTDLNGSSAKAGDSFNIAFGETRKTMHVIEAIPGKSVIWRCVKAYIDMESLRNKAEWEGTTMVWTLTSNEAFTTLHFLHEGLNEQFECYQVCEAGWDSFIASLETYLNTGKGHPYLKPAMIKTMSKKNEPVV